MIFLPSWHLPRSVHGPRPTGKRVECRARYSRIACGKVVEHCRQIYGMGLANSQVSSRCQDSGRTLLGDVLRHLYSSSWGHRTRTRLRTEVHLIPPLLVSPLLVPARLRRRIIKRGIDAPPVPLELPPSLRYVPLFGPRGADDGSLRRCRSILPIFLGSNRQRTH